MDMCEWLDEMTYRLLVCAEDGAEARERLAIVRHWVEAQDDRLALGEGLNVDHGRLVADALAELDSGGRPGARPVETAGFNGRLRRYREPERDRDHPRPRSLSVLRGPVVASRR